MAQRVLFDVSFDEVPLHGQRSNCSIRLSDAGSWEDGIGSRMELRISGDDKLDIGGGDVLQATCLAFSHIASTLSLRMKSGSRFFQPGTDSEIDFTANYFLPIIWDNS